MVKLVIEIIIHADFIFFQVKNLFLFFFHLFLLVGG